LGMLWRGPLAWHAPILRAILPMRLDPRRMAAKNRDMAGCKPAPQWVTRSLNDDGFDFDDRTIQPASDFRRDAGAGVRSRQSRGVLRRRSAFRLQRLNHLRVAGIVEFVSLTRHVDGESHRRGRRIAGWRLLLLDAGGIQQPAAPRFRVRKRRAHGRERGELYETTHIYLPGRFYLVSAARFAAASRWKLPNGSRTWPLSGGGAAKGRDASCNFKRAVAKRTAKRTARRHRRRALFRGRRSMATRGNRRNRELRNRRACRAQVCRSRHR